MLGASLHQRNRLQLDRFWNKLGKSTFNLFINYRFVFYFYLTNYNKNISVDLNDIEP